MQSFSFQTYAPLRVVDQNCRGGSDTCTPGQPFYVRFNNPLNVEKALSVLASEIKPRTDVRGADTYRVKLSQSLLKRTLMEFSGAIPPC